MPISFSRLPSTLQQLAIGKTTLYERIAQGLFPPPVKLGPRLSAWPQYEIDEVANAVMRNASNEDMRQLVAHLLEFRSHPNKAEALAA